MYLPACTLCVGLVAGTRLLALGIGSTLVRRSTFALPRHQVYHLVVFDLHVKINISWITFTHPSPKFLELTLKSATSSSSLMSFPWKMSLCLLASSLILFLMASLMLVTVTLAAGSYYSMI